MWSPLPGAKYWPLTVIPASEYSDIWARASLLVTFHRAWKEENIGTFLTGWPSIATKKKQLKNTMREMSTSYTKSIKPEQIKTILTKERKNGNQLADKFWPHLFVVLTNTLSRHTFSFTRPLMNTIRTGIKKPTCCGKSLISSSSSNFWKMPPSSGSRGSSVGV